MRPTRWRRSTRAVVGLVVLVLVAVVVAVAAVLTTGRNTDAQAAKPLPARPPRIPPSSRSPTPRPLPPTPDSPPRWLRHWPIRTSATWPGGSPTR